MHGRRVQLCNLAICINSAAMSTAVLQKYFSVLTGFRLYNNKIMKWAVEQILVRQKVSDRENSQMLKSNSLGLC